MYVLMYNNRTSRKARVKVRNGRQALRVKLMLLRLNGPWVCVGEAK